MPCKEQCKNRGRERRCHHLSMRGATVRTSLFASQTVKWTYCRVTLKAGQPGKVMGPALLLSAQLPHAPLERGPTTRDSLGFSLECNTAPDAHFAHDNRWDEAYNVVDGYEGDAEVRHGEAVAIVAAAALGARAYQTIQHTRVVNWRQGQDNGKECIIYILRVELTTAAPDLVRAARVGKSRRPLVGVGPGARRV